MLSPAGRAPQELRLGCVDLGVVSSLTTECGVPALDSACKTLCMTTFVVEPTVRMMWSTDDLASGNQLIEQAGQLNVVDRGRQTKLHSVEVLR